MITFPFAAVIVLLTTTIGAKWAALGNFMEIFETHPCHITDNDMTALRYFVVRSLFIFGIVFSSLLMVIVMMLKRSLMRRFWNYYSVATVCFAIGYFTFIILGVVSPDMVKEHTFLKYVRKVAFWTCFVSCGLAMTIDATHWVKYLNAHKYKWSGRMGKSLGIYYSLLSILTLASMTLLAIGTVYEDHRYCFWTGYLLSIVALLDYSLQGVIIQNNHCRTVPKIAVLESSV